MFDPLQVTRRREILNRNTTPRQKKRPFHQALKKRPRKLKQGGSVGWGSKLSGIVDIISHGVSPTMYLARE